MNVENDDSVEGCGCGRMWLWEGVVGLRGNADHNVVYGNNASSAASTFSRHWECRRK